MKQRIEWLAVLRGVNILLVVMVHVQLVDMSTGENHSFCNDLSFPFYPIRMPLFIFISGGLLYLSRIRKNISTKALYKDKFQRIMIPFFFFVTFYYLLKVLFINFTKTSTSLSINYFLESFIYFSNHPSAPLWFLATLMLFMLLYPLFCFLCKNNILMFIFLLFSAAFSFVDLDVQSSWNIFSILDVNHYLIYFFFGIFFFKYEIYKYLKGFPILIALIIIYCILFYFQIKLAVSLVGIMMLISLCLLVAAYYPNLFSSFREYIFQIYLMSLPFQTFVELILWKHLFYNEHLFYIFYIVNVLSGLMIPVLIAKFIERCSIRVIRLCFGLQ